MDAHQDSALRVIRDHVAYRDFDDALKAIEAARKEEDARREQEAQNCIEFDDMLDRYMRACGGQKPFSYSERDIIETAKLCAGEFIGPIMNYPGSTEYAVWHVKKVLFAFAEVNNRRAKK